MEGKIKVGICGVGMAKATLAQLYPVAEVQQTFYQPPEITTLEKWRTEVPDTFEFTVKAWQLITHTGKSPTYRRLKRERTDEEKMECGGFRSTPIVEEGWERTRDSALALRASKILFQCPPSFKPIPENLENLMHFFSTRDREKGARRGLTFLWEPRGPDWTPELVRELCEELDLVHVVDPFSGETVTPEQIYYRLHGRGSYSYIYSDEELAQLALMLPAEQECYVMFNNVKMRQDSIRFMELLKARKLK